MKIIFIIFLFVIAMPVFAQTPPLQPVTNINTTQDIVRILDKILQFAFSILGIVSVMVILYAGGLFMLSGDDEERRKKAKGYLLWGAVGVAVAILAGSIIRIVENILQGI